MLRDINIEKHGSKWALLAMKDLLTKKNLQISVTFQSFLRNSPVFVMFVFSCSTSLTYIGQWPQLKRKKPSVLSQKPMIAFDICAPSISSLLCLISEFGSIITIRTLLVFLSVCHITPIFSRSQVQFLGATVPWIYLEFQILLPCCKS